MKRQRTLNISQYITFLLLLIPSMVLAATDPGNPLNFRPPATDMSVVFLGNIFGVVDGILHGSGSQIMGAMFGVFNAAILSLGGILLMYTLIIGTLNTAHQGSTLGEKWSTMWVPIRSAMAVALLIPKASGYCLMQIFVMWVVVQGVGAADKTWDAALDYLGRGGVIVQHSLGELDFGDDKVSVASNILTAQVCMHSIQEVLKEQRDSDIAQNVYEEGSASDPGPVPNLANTVNIMKANTDAADTGENPKVSMPNITEGKYAALNGVCGTLTWKPFSSSKIKKLAENLGVSKDSSILEQATLARALGVNQMYLNMGSVAEIIVRNYMNTKPEDQLPLGEVDGDGSVLWISGDPDKPALLQGTEVKGAATDYYAIVLPTLKSLSQDISSDTKFIDHAKKEGWIMAGSYFFDLTQLNRNAGSLITDKDSVSVDLSKSPDNEDDFVNVLAPIMKNINATYINDAITAEKNTQTYITYARILQQTLEYNPDYPKWDYSIPNIPKFKIPKVSRSGNICKFSILGHKMDPCQGAVNFAVNALNVSTKNVTTVFSDFLVDKVLNNIIKVMNVVILYIQQAGTMNADPIETLAKIGDLCITLAIELWALSIVVLVLAAIPFVGQWVIAIVIFLLPIITATIGFLSLWGLILAYYVPLVPYLFFIFAALGWFIEVLQAMVAAPLLALGIAHPEGQHEVFGKAEPGIMLLLSVFLRPVLMIIGLIAGMILTFVSMWLVDATFWHIFSGVRSLSSFAGWVLSWVMFFFIYVAIAVVLVNKSMTPIYQLHTMIMQLFGYSSGAGVDVASMAEEIKGGVSKVGDTAGGALGQMAQKGIEKKGSSSSGSTQVSGNGVELGEAAEDAALLL